MAPDRLSDYPEQFGRLFQPRHPFPQPILHADSSEPFMRFSQRLTKTLGRLLGGALVASITSAASAVDLKVGDKAPAVDVKEWIQGETSVGEGKPYVVEFWATWCGPCKKAIPHINELYNKYKDSGFTVIGITDEEKEISKVKNFVRQQGDRMTYPVAIDDGAKNAWMQAAGQKGIPCSFIVDAKNTIAFIGHPMDDQFDDILAQVVAGRYNPKLQKQARPKLAAADRAEKVANWADAYRHLDEVIGLDSTVFLSVALRKYRMLACGEKNADATEAWGENLLKTYSDDAGALEAIARLTANEPTECVRDLKLARKAADRLLSLQGPSNPDALATSAMVDYAAGDKDKAIRQQMQAWMAVKPDLKDTYKRQLDVYRGQAGRGKRR